MSHFKAGAALRKLVEIFNWPDENKEDDLLESIYPLLHSYTISVTWFVCLDSFPFQGVAVAMSLLFLFKQHSLENAVQEK